MISNQILSNQSQTESQKGKAKQSKPTALTGALTIAICSQKGGVGKTTTTVNLSSALNLFHNKKVLVIDLDPQGHVEKSLGAIIPEGIEYAPLSEILGRNQGSFREGIIRTEIENFDLSPGDKALYETENILATKIGKEFILDTLLEPVKEHYDFIILDCPPNLGNLTINGLATADYCLVPCEMSVLAFEGVNDLIETSDTIKQRINPRLQILGILFTRVDHRNQNMNQIIEENMKNYFKNKVLNTQISVNTDLNKAQLEGLPIFHFKASSSGSENYQQLALEVLEKIKKKKKSDLQNPLKQKQVSFSVKTK